VNVAALLADEVRRDGARPFLTWYDDATGERVELSVATITNWAVKTANLLSDEHGLEPGDPIRLSPADHWLSFVAVLGAWHAGLCVAEDADVELPGDPKAFTAAVLPQPDVLLAPSSAEVSYGAIEAQAGLRLMSTHSLSTPGGVALSLGTPLDAHGSVVMVANANPSRLADRAAMERVTHTAGCDVHGLPRLD